MFTHVASGTVGVLCLLIAVLLWVVAEKKAAVAIVCLILAGAFMIAGTLVGGWIHTGVDWADGMMGHVIGWVTGAVIGFGLAVVLAFIYGHDLWVLIRQLLRKRDGDVKNRTAIAAGLLPFTASAIPGPVGAAVVAGIAAIASIPAAIIGFLFGIH
jgi:hypothetical protein